MFCPIYYYFLLTILTFKSIITDQELNEITNRHSCRHILFSSSRCLFYYNFLRTRSFWFYITTLECFYKTEILILQSYLAKMFLDRNNCNYTCHQFNLSKIPLTDIILTQRYRLSYFLIFLQDKTNNVLFHAFVISVS